jgi:2-phosphosulfolactate phosphatase
MDKSIDVCFLPQELDEKTLPERSAVVIDILRASTTITYALKYGARDVIPVPTPTRASELREQIGGKNTLLCGERLGIKIDGFDLGNSPSEYTPEIVTGKTLIFASSNGSQALIAAGGAQRMAMGAFVNARAIADWVCAETIPCVLVCSGKLGQFSGEDAACCGHLVSILSERGFHPGNDAARCALDMNHRAGGDWLSMLKQTDHGRYLMELGFERDLVTASTLNAESLVPVWRNNRLTASVTPGKA